MTNTEILNDLVLVNKDRAVGYDKASVQTIDDGICQVFKNMAAQSRSFITELERLERAEGNEPLEGESVNGKIHKTWLDMNVAFGADDRRSLLDACCFGEEAIQYAYTSALSAGDIKGDTRSIIESEETALKKAYLAIKKIREEQPA